MIQQNKEIKFLIILITILSFAPVVASAAPFAYITNYGSDNVSVIDTSTNTVTATITVGTNPYSVAVNPAGTLVYVANRGSDSVSVINTSTNTVTATVTVGTNPCGVAVNPAGTLVYVANSGSGSVSVIDTSTNTVTTVTVGTNPYGVAVNPAGTHVYVANRGSNNVSVIDTSTNLVTDTVTVGIDPYGVAVNPAGSHVYVVNYVSNNVSVIDTSTNTVTTVAVGSSPRGVAVNPAGTHVYVANSGSNSVSVIDTSTNTVTTVTVGSSPFGVAVNPAGTLVYVANYNSDNVSVIDTSTNTITDTVTVGTNPVAFGIFISPGGASDTTAPFAYITNYDSNSVSVIDTSNNTVTDTVTVGTDPYSVAVNPAGTHVYVANRGSADVSVIDASTNTVTTTITVGSSPCGVAVNSAGTLVYVANSGSDSVSVIDTSTNLVTETVSVQTNPYGVAVNPAGTRVYVANRGSDSVSVIDTSTNTVTDTITVGTDPFGVTVNPAGTRLYVANYMSNNVSVIDTSTNTVTATVTVESSPRGVAVNPAGTRLYVANYVSNSVSVIDTSTNTVTDTVMVESNPFGVAVNTAGTHVYVANYNSDNVSVIDTSTNTVTDTVTVGTKPVAFGIFISPVGTVGKSACDYPEFVNITIDDGVTKNSIIFANHSDSTTEGNWISLNGGDPIELPSPFTLTYYGTNFSSKIKDGKTINVTIDVEDNTDYVVPYPHTTHDMFTNVSGKNSVSMYFNGTTCFANDYTDVYLVKISKTSLKDAFNDITDGNIAGFYYNLLGKGNPYETKLNEPLDVNGDMNLAFSEVDAGDYAIFILLNNSDLYNKSILSTTTFQVLEYDSTTTVPSEVIRGNTFNANITLTNAPTDTNKYIAVLVHESAYYAEMQLRFNGTRAGTNLTLNDVDIIRGYEVLGVGFSSVNITTVLDTIGDGIDPIDGSVMNITSETNNASIVFDTNGLRAGNYILLTEVYNSVDKLVAFGQSEIIISTESNVLCGFVKDPSNRPISGAEIRIGTTIKNTTDASGYYRISSVNNDSFVSASKDNYVTNSTSVTILADEINRQNFTLTPTKAKVYVTVKDDEGTAIKGALVSINTMPVTTGTTDPDGKCTLYLSIESAASFIINASKTNYETNEEVISLAIADVKSVSLPLNQSRVVVGLAPGETAVKFAENTTDATFIMYIENYGGSAANFTVENFTTTTATVVINETSIMMEPSTVANIMVNVTSSDVGTYPVTIKVRNSTQVKSATIDLVAIMKNSSVAYIDTATCTVNGTVSNGSVITDNSDVDTNASVTNGSVFGYCDITGISQVVDSVIMDNSTITNATVLGNSMVSTSNVSDFATVTAASVVESSNITGSETTISNAIVTNATVINSVVTGVTISNVTLYGAIVKPNDDGVAVITKGRIVTENVDFRNVYTEIPIEKLVFAQSGTIVGASTVADDRQTLGTYIDINANPGIMNVSVCLISPDSPEGATAAPLASDISGMKNEKQLGKFIHIKNSSTVNSAEVRIYIDQVDKDNYNKFYVAYHTDGNKLVTLGDSIGTPVYDEEIGCWYVAGNTTHFSTFTLIGANKESGDNGDDNGGSGGRTGSGGGATGEELENVLISETERETVYMNSKVSYSFDLEGNIVRYINFTGLTSAGRVAAKVEILNHTSSLVEHAPADIVYKNLNIFIGNLGWATSKNIANPTVQFEVEKSWVSENNIDISAITLNRYYDGKWNPVLTTMIGECPDYLYFESQPPGFSPFAVTGTTGGAKVTPTETGVSPDTGTATPTPTEEKPGIPGFEAIGALGMITVVYCMYRRRA